MAVLKRIFINKEPSRIDNLLHKRDVEISDDYNVRRVVYPNGKQEYYIYNYTINKIQDGYELEKKSSITNIWPDIKIEKKSILSENKDKFKREINKRNLNRSLRNLMELCKANEEHFISFVTLTFKENNSDLSEANKVFNSWCSNFRKLCFKYGIDLMYLGVPEFQKRGAVHYHLLLNVPVNSEMIPLQEGEKNKYDVMYWKRGFSSAYDLTITDNNFRVEKYISKYFWKNIDNRLFGHKKILKSNNLKKPVYEYYNVSTSQFLDNIDNSKPDFVKVYEGVTIFKYDSDKENYCLNF